MKLKFELIVVALVLALTPAALRAQVQAPLGISYQAIVRAPSGAIVASQPVRLRFSIRDTLITGTVIYRETHSVTTNTQGLINLFIGQGTVSLGDFSTINWGSANKFLQVEIDVTGGTSYTDLGTQQMMSVPYAMYARTAGSVSGSSGAGSDAKTLIYTITGF